MAGKSTKRRSWLHGPRPTAVSRPNVKQFACQACGGQVSVRLPGKSLVATCDSCAAIVDCTDENYRVLSTFAQKAPKPDIAIGSRGKLHGQEFEVVGYLMKVDQTEVYHWEEYLLFNPYVGYRWLVENQGHWNYVIPLKSTVDCTSLNALYNGKYYRSFLKGTAKVVAVLGEFYWRVKHGDTAIVADYIAAPEMLSSEETEDESHWSIGEYVLPSVIQQAFQVKNLPNPVGVAPNQPSPVKNFSGTFIVAGYIFFAMFLIQIATAIEADNSKVFFATEDHPKSTAPKEFVSEPFEVTGRDSNIVSEAHANVSNSWLEVETSLVNETTGQSYDFRHVIEYYYGSGWSEGSTKDTVVLPSIPAGKYRIRAESMADATTRYSITLWRDQTLWSNLLVTLGLLLAYPAAKLVRAQSFEAKRWENSDLGGGTET